MSENKEREVSPNVVANSLEVSIDTVYRWIDARKIEARQTVTRRWKIPTREIVRIKTSKTFSW